MSMQNTKISWLKIVLIPIFCYLPAFGLVWMSFHFFKPTTELDIEKLTVPPYEKARNNSRLDEGIAKLPTSELARAYIQKEIEIEAKKQSEQSVKDEIEKLRADWKGDLFGQISFPVIFAVASIFAAFAVKDILTEILKEQEKEGIKQELRKELEDQVVPEVIEKNQQEISSRIETIESYTYWLEYETLAMTMNQVLNDIKKTSVESTEIDEYILPIIRQFFSREDFILDRVSNKVRNVELELLKKSNLKVLRSNFGNVFLSTKLDECFEARVKELEDVRTYSGSKELELKYGIIRMETLFHMQMKLLKATLWRLQKEEVCCNENNVFFNETENLLNEVEKCLQIDTEERYKENKEKARQQRLKSQVELPPPKEN